jgi:ATP-dependent Zn protease
LLAGRVAEEEFFPESISTGATHDLDMARKMAFQMITQYGMGYKAIHGYGSDNSKKEVEMEMGQLLEKAFATARTFISRHRHIIEEGAQYLIRERTLLPEWFQERVPH